MFRLMHSQLVFQILGFFLAFSSFNCQQIVGQLVCVMLNLPFAISLKSHVHLFSSDFNSYHKKSRYLIFSAKMRCHIRVEYTLTSRCKSRNQAEEISDSKCSRFSFTSHLQPVINMGMQCTNHLQKFRV